MANPSVNDYKSPMSLMSRNSVGNVAFGTRTRRWNSCAWVLQSSKYAISSSSVSSSSYEGIWALIAEGGGFGDVVSSAASVEGGDFGDIASSVTSVGSKDSLNGQRRVDVNAIGGGSKRNWDA